MPGGTILRDVDGDLKFIIKITDITPFEEDLSDRIRDKMKTWLQSILLLGNNKQKVVANDYPYMREDCVYGCAIEYLDMVMLLYPLKDIMRSFA